VSLRHPSKFQWVSRLAFITAATSLTGGQPNFAQCLAVSWAGTLYIRLQGLLPLTEFCPVTRCNIHFTSKSCVLLQWQHYCMALQPQASAKLCGVVQGMELRNFRRGCHLYSAGWPSRWALAHILVTDGVVWSVCGCSVTILSCAKPAEPTEMPLGVWTQVGYGITY